MNVDSYVDEGLSIKNNLNELLVVDGFKENVYYKILNILEPFKDSPKIGKTFLFKRF